MRSDVDVAAAGEDVAFYVGEHGVDERVMKLRSVGASSEAWGAMV